MLLLSIALHNNIALLCFFARLHLNLWPALPGQTSRRCQEWRIPRASALSPLVSLELLNRWLAGWLAGVYIRFHLQVHFSHHQAFQQAPGNALIGHHNTTHFILR